MRQAPLAMSRALVALLALAAPAHAEADGPDYFRVTGLAEGDVLTLRALPDDGATRLGDISGTADGLRNLGCEGGLSFAEWQEASEAERAAAEQARWCRIRHGSVEGWVPARFLAEGSAPAATPVDATEGRSPDWRLITVNGQMAQGDPAIGFTADGVIFGRTGCNRFSARGYLEGGTLIVDGPVATTQMACPGPLATQDSEVLAVLSGPIAVGFDPFRARLFLSTAAGTLALDRQHALGATAQSAPAQAPGAAAPAAAPVAAESPEDPDTAEPPAEAHSFQPADGAEYWAVSGLEGRLNIRAEATTAARVLTTVQPGTVVRNRGCTEAEGRRWCDIETLDGSQLRGWAAADYLEPAEPALRAGQ